MSPGANGALEGVEVLFRDSLSSRQSLKPGRGISWLLLLILAITLTLHLLAVIVVLILNVQEGALPGMFFLNPLATAETISKLVLLISLALVGAYNDDIRRPVVWLLVAAQFIAVGSLLGLFLVFPPGTVYPGHHAALVPNAILDGIPLCVLFVMALTIRSSGDDASIVQDPDPQTPASRLVRLLLLVYGIVFSSVAVTAIAARTLLPQASVLASIAGGPDPLLANVITEYLTLGAICFLVSGRASLRKYFIPVLMLCLTAGVVTSLIGVLQGDTIIVTGDNLVVRVTWIMPLHLILDVVALAALIWLRRLQYRIDYQITALGPGSAECVMSLHRAFRETAQKPGESVRDTLQRIDEYIVGIRGRQRGIIAFPFWMVEYVFPVLALFRPPFSTMSRAEQRWMLRRYVIRPGYERARALIPALADGMFMIGDSVHSLLTFAYFSSSSGQAEAGYVLPNARQRLQPDIAVVRPPEADQPLPLPRSLDDPVGRKPPGAGAPFLLTPRVSVPDPAPALPSEADYCIIGSGAAGGVLAYRLAVARGGRDSICVLEKGGHYSPVQHFNEDEMQMVRMLYADGGLQTTQSLDFTILQGQCVGGSTVINNALCFEMPEVSKREWRGFGIDADGLSAHYDRVAAEINIGELTAESVNHRVEDLFSHGVDGYNATVDPANQLSPAHRMRGNFSNCVGCGLCNIGCRRLRKMSVLETYIPWSEARGVTVIPNAGAVRCTTVSSGAARRVTSVLVRKSNGDVQTLRINKALIVSAGAIASSRFLMRSEVGGQHVGQDLSCNYAFPLIVEFDREVDAFDGLQMTLFAAPGNHECVFETTFNPPGTQSVMIAQYFDRHERMMKAYRKSMVLIALVGSDPSGSVSSQPGLLYGRDVEWNQTPDEITRIKRAFAIGTRIACEAGASRVLLPSLPVLEVPCGPSAGPVMERFNAMINDKKYFRFATPHPQGGNMMAAGTFDERVVGTDFRVRGCENLFVCDASVFPRGIRVNPQWSIMAVASSAGERIAAET